MSHVDTTAQQEAIFIQGGALGTEGLSPVGPVTEEEPLATEGTFFDPTAPGAGEEADLSEFGITGEPAAPTTIDSELAEERTIDNQAQLAQFSADLEKAQQQALTIQEGLGTLAAKEKAAEDAAAEVDLKTFDELVTQSAPITGVTADSAEAIALKKELDQARIDSNNELSIIKSKLDTLAVKVDSDTAATIASLKGIYESRRQQQIQINAQRVATLGVLGAVSGRLRFAPEIQFGILNEQERRNIQALAALDAEEARLIAAANSANTAQQFDLLDQRIAALQDNREARIDIATTLYSLAVDEEKRIIEANQREQLDQENSIALIAPAVLDEIGLDNVGTDASNAIILKAAQEMGVNPLQLSGIVSALADEQIEETKDIRGILVKEVNRQVLINPITGETIAIFGPAKVETASDVDSFALQYPSLSKQDIINASSLVVERFGKRAIKTMLPFVLAEMHVNGKTIDDIEDEIRLSETSPEFEGVFKDAFFALTRTGFTQFQRNENREELDRLLEGGDTAGARDFIIGLSRDGLKADQQKIFDENLNSVDALEAIRQDLRLFIQEGGDTNIFTGVAEDVLQALGTTTDPRLAEIANRIGLTLVSYRRAVSGAAFTEAEAAAYEALFPSKGNLPELNEAKIDSIITELTRNRNNVIKARMGATNFSRLFGEGLFIDVSLGDTKRSYTSVRFRDEKTGEIYDVTNVSQAQLDEAIGSGWVVESINN